MKEKEVGRPVIYTVGTSTRSPEEFLALLRRYGIRAVVDVRRFPSSRRYPHFNRAALAAWLGEAGVTYHYLGDKLGGYRPGGYEGFTRTKTFQEGISELAALALKEPTAILCSERFPWKCHRRFIAQHLAACGWEARHILDEKRVYVPKQS
jgi:uncharacterized protein (DUF488 family)